MKKLSIATAMALAAMLAILPGCDNKPDESIPAATTNNTAVEPKPAPDATPAEPAAVEKPMEAAPAAVEAPAEPAPAPAPAGEPATYAIAPNDVNTIGFVGYKVTGKKQGAWTDYSGTVELPDGAIESAKISITFKMGSMSTSAQLLTDTLHNESWFNVAKFPDATFTSTKVEKDGDGYKVTGDLVIRGTSKNISFPAQIQIDGGQLKTQAQFKLNRSDWGMVDTGLADDLIKDEVVIQFDIVADKV